MLIASAPAEAQQDCVSEPKFNPGHYVSPTKSSQRKPLTDLLISGVRGLQIRYRWAELEPTEGQYDFSAIRKDLAALEQTGGQLVAFIEDKSFDGTKPTPEYLLPYTLKNRNGGYTVKRWDPYVIERMSKLIGALGAEFDCSSGFEGIALQESALSLEDSVLTANNYTPEKYRDALTAVLKSAANDLPNSTVFWYMNFLRKKQAYLADIAAAVAQDGVAMGGPDILPDNRALQLRAYPLYDEFAGRMTLFGSMQFDSYAHPKVSVPGADKAYWTMDEMFSYARDKLHVQYIFWNHKTWRKPPDSFSWEDAVPVIEANPTFND